MFAKALTSVAVLLGLAAAPAVAQDAGKTGKMAMHEPEGREATVTGTVIDVSCKYSHGLTGAEHRMCAQVCADKGIPLAILGDDGKLYLPVSTGMPGDPQNGKLREYAEQHVSVRGKVLPASGAQAIQIASVTPKS